MEEFSQLLNQYVRRTGISDAELARSVGVSRQTIFRWREGVTGRPRHRLLYVGDHLGDDVRGAQAAGLDAVLIDRRDQRLEAPCPRIASLLDLVPYIQAPSQPAPAIVFDMDGRRSI